MTYLNNNEVLQLATKWHEGQKRKDGKDYITHPIAVAEITLTLAKKNYFCNNLFLDILYQTAILHDVMEDCEGVDKELLSASPEWAKEKPFGTFRSEDLWVIIDKIRNENEVAA